jgi:hypothetical protein
VERCEPPHRIVEAARGLVRCGMALTPQAITQDTARCDLAGTVIGMSDCPGADVLTIWLARRLRRDLWPIDEPVDDALRDLAPHLYLMFGGVYRERDPASRAPRH